MNDEGYKHHEDDFERAKPAPIDWKGEKSKRHNVEILTDGMACVVKIDGFVLHAVTDLSIPIEHGHMKPALTLGLIAQSINMRTVTSAELQDACRI